MGVLEVLRERKAKFNHIAEAIGYNNMVEDGNELNGIEQDYTQVVRCFNLIDRDKHSIVTELRAGHKIIMGVC